MGQDLTIVRIAARLSRIVRGAARVADHFYFECFEDFLPENGIEFYYYDQLDSTKL
jgi:hypothetical protein